MLFSAFSNDGLGHKDMADMLAHPGFGGEVQASWKCASGQHYVVVLAYDYVSLG